MEAPIAAPAGLTERFPEGSRLVRLGAQGGTGRVANLTPDFFAAADPQISSDAGRILFSGQKAAGSPWQVWEMRADGSEQRQVTHGPGDCLKPAYLPPGEIVFTAAAGKAPRQFSAVYVAHADGTGVHPVTFGPGNFQSETVLRDGRILLSAESRLVPDHQGGPSRVFYTMRPDGTGLTSFRWGLSPGWIRGGADELDDGTVIFVERKAAAAGQAGGEMAWIRPGLPHNSVVTPAASQCWSAHQLQGQILVVAGESASRRSARGKFDLYAFDPESGTPGRLLYRDPRYSSVQAVPLAPRRDPRSYWSILHPEKASGRVVCLNSYRSADAPRGRFAARIARVRVVMLEEDGSRQRPLGEAPVETDGSFYLAVPADRPIRFELLGPKGEVIRAQQSWVWVRPGEDRGCLGCHEDHARAPENRWPLALRRSDAPIPMGLPQRLDSTRH